MVRCSPGGAAWANETHSPEEEEEKKDWTMEGADALSERVSEGAKTIWVTLAG